MSFSEDLQQLERIIRRLEEGQMPLEEALSLFRQGTETLRTCRAFLRETSQEVRLLSENDPEDVTGSPWISENHERPRPMAPNPLASDILKEEKE